MLQKSYIFIPILLISLNLNSASLIDIGKEQEKKENDRTLTAIVSNDFSKISYCQILWTCWHKLFSCCYTTIPTEIIIKTRLNKDQYQAIKDQDCYLANAKLTREERV